MAKFLPYPRSLFIFVVLLQSAAHLACHSENSIRIEGEVVRVACGRCLFEMEGAQGCPWAAEIGGEHYMIRGPLPSDHSSHAPDGICNMTRSAIVDGAIKDGELIASRFELLPAESVPESPRFTPEDRH